MGGREQSKIMKSSREKKLGGNQGNGRVKEKMKQKSIAIDLKPSFL